MYQKVLFSFLLFSSSLVHAQWTAVTSPTNTDLKGIYCTDNTTCYAVGVGGKAYKSTNWGANWTIMSIGTTKNLHGIRFISGSVGFVLSGEGIYKTITAGGSWNKSYNYNYAETCGAFDMYGSLGVAACPDETTPTVGPARTTNSGTSWTSFGTFASVFSSQALYGCDVVNANLAVMVGGNTGSNKNLFISTNGGQNWTDKSITTGVLRAVHFADANTGYVVGEGGILLKTTNAGVNWSKMTFPTGDNLTSCWFISPQMGFVGTTGKIYMTANGGTTWTVSATITGNKSIYALYFPSSNVGYAVGEGGIVYKYAGTTSLETEVNGQNWTIFPNPAQENVHFSVENLANLGNKLELSILNNLGQTVGKYTVEQSEQDISVADLPRGIYQVILQNDEKRMIKRLIKN